MTTCPLLQAGVASAGRAYQVHKSSISIVGAIVLTAAFIGPVHANTVAFDNLGAGNAGYGSGPAGTGGEGDLEQMGASGTLSSITLPVGYSLNSEAGDPFSLSVYTDSAAGQIGSLLETLNGTLTAQYQNGTVGGSFNDVTTLNSTVHPVLQAGVDYWFVLTDPNGAAVWQTSNAGSSLNTEADGTYYGGGHEAAALSVSVNPVPLPAAAWLLLGALGALGIASRKRLLTGDRCLCA